ncbi:MAG: hypothetical protein K1X79_13850 [Oligoflexia bacterium]|nr:hypothetical protein [Oligoflexia bacterium]
MKQVSLSEFQRLTALPDRAVLWLLYNNRIKCSVDASKGLLVDIDSVENADIVGALTARQESVTAQNMETLSAQVGDIIQDELDRIVDEACARLQTK